MIMMFQPEDIGRWWPFVKDVLLSAQPPMVFGADDWLNPIYKELLVGKAQCWVVFYPPENGTGMDPRGIAITLVGSETVTGTRNLTIYSLAAVPGKRLTAELVREGQVALERFAAQNGCRNIIAFVHDTAMEGWTSKLDLGYERSVLFRKGVTTHGQQ